MQLNFLGTVLLGSDRASTAIKDALTPREPFGLTLTTPYVRGKIPVVFIHGLWMNPASWDKMIAQLRADASLDDRFQFWTFGYSTGDPIPYAALLLRQSLNQVRHKLDPDRADPAFDRMILVGHSLGGLLSKMMVVESGDQLWRVLSPRRVEELRGEKNDVEQLTSALVFHRHPEVRRVIFIATPHGGSKVDSGSIRQLGNRLARITDLPLGIHHRLSKGNDPQFFHPYFYEGLPTSVEELKVKGPLLVGLGELPIAPDVRSHSIIAIRPNSPAEAPTDGLVTVESARIGGVASEKVVTCPHLLCLEDREVTAEVARILREHEATR